MSLIRDAFDEPKSPDKISIDVNTSVAYGKPGYDCMGHLERDLKPYVYWEIHERQKLRASGHGVSVTTTAAGSAARHRR
jgi:hypothetical protein